MCEGYWETCNCEDCKEVKELYEALEFYWDNKEEKEEIEKDPRPSSRDNSMIVAVARRVEIHDK